MTEYSEKRKDMNEKIIKLQHKMRKKLDANRYEHTLGVMYTAAALAMRHEVDMEDALLAGLLHDCAKCYPDDKKMELCRKHHVALTDVERENTALIHAKLGAALARDKYGVDNEQICRAIATHTTGSPAMEPLQKIIFIADYIEPHRDRAVHLDEIRHAAFEDLDKACRMILTDTLTYLSGSPKMVDPMTKRTYEYYNNLQMRAEGEAKG